MEDSTSPAPARRDLPLFDPRLTGMRFLDEAPSYLVYEGNWGEDALPCVAKMPRDAAQSTTARATLRAEAQVLTVLDSVAGAPKLLHFDLAGPTLVNTRPPGERLVQLPPEWLRDVPRLLQWGSALAAVLGDVHAAHVFHGDLRPDTLLVDRNTLQAVPIAFGQATTQSHVDLDFTHPTLLGRALPFSAPEQTGRMGRAVDYRADLYALGAVLYWALTGRPPFVETEPLALLHALLTRAPPPPESLNPSVPPALSAIVMKLLAKNPQERYQSAHGVQADLLRIAAAPGGLATFTAGAADHRIQPAQPSQLFGREADLSRLERALDGDPDRCRVVLVQGYSGAGKTTLVRALHPRLSERGGIFAAGRYDEYQRLTPFSGLAQALTDLAEYWLAEPPDELERLRTQLRAALGSNAQVLARLAPAFARVLWAPRAQPAVSSVAPSVNVLQRLRRTLTALCRVIRQCGVPVMLFIDNLQWADAGSLALFESIALNDSAAPLLLIGAYRSNEVDPTHPLSPVLKRLRDADIELVEITADRLGPDATHALVTDVLAGTPSDQHAMLAPLAQALHRRTEGNPFFVLQYLRRLCDDGQLRSVAGRWQWDDAALRELPGSDNLITALVRELERLPPHVRHLAGGCACVGGAIDIDLLASAIDALPEHVDVWLRPLLQRDILLATTPADLLDAGGSVVHARGGARRVRFCHDRMQQAAYAALSEAERVQWHACIARVLETVQVPAADAMRQRFSVANHRTLSLAAIASADEADHVVDLLLLATADAVATGAFDSALRFVLGAQALQPRIADDATRQLAVERLHHRALCGLARHDAADASFAVLTGMAGGDAVAIAEAIVEQAATLTVRMRWAEATELLLTHLRTLGVSTPDEGAWDAALEAEVDTLYATLDARGREVFEHLAGTADPRATLASMLLAALTTSATRWRPVVSRWAAVLGVRLGLQHGASAALAQMLASLGAVFSALRGDRVTGYALMQSGMRMLEQHPDPWYIARCQTVAAQLVRFCFEPLEQTLALNRVTHVALVEAGDAEYVNLCQISMLTEVLETAPHLDASLAESEQAEAIAARMGDRWRLGFAATRQFTRCLAGLTEAIGSFDDPDVREVELLGNERVNFRLRVRYGTFRAFGAALFGDWPAALRYSRDALDAAGKLVAGYHDLLLQWVHAMALAQALRTVSPAEQAGLRDRLAPLRQQFAEQAQECARNFGHLHELLRAMLAWADDDFRTAAVAFEAAITTAHTHRRAGHHAFALELAAEFHAAHGLMGPAAAYFRHACAAYSAWGAKGKLAQLRSHALYAPTAETQGAHRAPAIAGLDVIGVTEAAQLLAHERDPERLPALLFDLVRRYAAAEHGRLLWCEDTRWVERAGFTPDRQWIGMLGDPRPRPAGEAALPAALLNYLTQSLEPLLLRDVTTHARFGAEADVRALGIKSIVALPIRHRGQVVGLLYLDNRQTHTELAAGHLETLGLMGLQFAVAFESAQVHHQLEALVAQKTAEARRGDRVLQSILDTAPVMITLRDPQGRFLMHNGRYVEAIGRHGADLIGTLAYDLAPDEERRREWRRLDQQVLNENRPVMTTSEWTVTGSTRTFQVHRFPVGDPGDAPYALGTISIDVTELRRSQQLAEAATEAAEVAARAKSDFLANMSHEIRTPMNGILGMSQLALNSGLTPQQHNYVVKIERSARSLLGIINDILDFSKIEAGKIAIEHTPFELAAVFDSLATLIALDAETKRLELLFDLPLTLPGVLIGDPLRLGQVLLNLSSNAVKFTEAGEIVVRVEAVERGAAHAVLRFSVTDTGVGMSDAVRARLFQPFEQADSSTSRRYGGSGLGLAISRQLATLMGGTIEARSRPGEGSRFEFTLPFALPSAPAASGAAAAPALPVLRGRRVLVIDANPVARARIATMLGELGAEVDQAERGDAVPDGARHDLVLVGCMIPDTADFEALRRRPASALVPIVAMAGTLARDALLARLAERQLAIRSVLAKPVTPTALAAVCANALGALPPAVPDRSQHAVARHARAQQLSGARVLLVEDNEINRELAVDLLRDVGIVVEVAEDGREALARLAAEPPYDIVLMDCQMPVMDGYAATREIRRHPKWADLPIIAMTANAMSGDAEKALSSGMSDHIAKPIDIPAMFTTLARWYRR